MIVYEWEMDKALDRFFSKVDDHGSIDDCWIWKAVTNGTGYGRFSYKSRYWLAHRWIYVYCYKTIEEKAVIDHLCGNTLCVNPYHLEAITRGENRHRGGADHRT